AFCVVPRARGASRSLAPGVVLEQARRLVEAGHPEIVLTGVDLGHFGADLLPRATLAALLRELVGLPGLRWVRLSSVLPAYFTPELLELVTTAQRIAPHFHVPLQSGSDRVLRLMRRPYNTRVYRDLVERLARAFHALGLGAEVLVLETRARATGRLVGLSGNYVEVQFDGPDGLMGRLTRVRVTDVERDRTLGEVA